MEKRKKRIIATLSAVAAVAALSLLWFFTVPFVRVTVPGDTGSAFASRLPFPSTSPFLLVERTEDGKEGLLSKIRKPSLVIASPLSENIWDGTVPLLMWGASGGDADIFLPFDREHMYADALSELEGRSVAFLFSSDDSVSATIYESLSRSFRNVEKVTYEGRITGVDRDAVVSQLDAFWGVIVASPEESQEAWRNTRGRVIMDSRYAASVCTLDRVISIVPDWRSILSSLPVEGVIESPRFTLTVLHK